MSTTKHGPETISFPGCVELTTDTSHALGALGIIEHVGRVNTDLHAMSWLLLVLRELPDIDSTFPRGKWATIQHIQSRLSDAARHRASEITKVAYDDSILGSSTR